MDGGLSTQDCGISLLAHTNASRGASELDQCREEVLSSRDHRFPSRLAIGFVFLSFLNY